MCVGGDFFITVTVDVSVDITNAVFCCRESLEILMETFYREAEKVTDLVLRVSTEHSNNYWLYLFTKSVESVVGLLKYHGQY